MATHICLVMTNPVDGKEDAYNDWYDNQHLEDVMRECGCTSARRYRLSSMDPAQQSDYRYAAIYEVETDDPDAVNAALMANFATPAMPASDALDLTSLKVWFFEQTTCRP